MVGSTGPLFENDDFFRGKGHEGPKHGIKDPIGHGKEKVGRSIGDGAFRVGHAPPNETGNEANGDGFHHVEGRKDTGLGTLQTTMNQDTILGRPRCVVFAGIRSAANVLIVIVTRQGGVHLFGDGIVVPCHLQLQSWNLSLVVGNAVVDDIVHLLLFFFLVIVIVLGQFRTIFHDQQIHPMIGGIVSIGTCQVLGTQIREGINGRTKIDDITLTNHEQSIKTAKQLRRRLMNRGQDGLAVIFRQTREQSHEGDGRGTVQSTSRLIQ